MDRRLEEQVWARARSCCEYCHFPNEFAEYPFHIDHIIAKKHGGRTDAENLALSCFFCNTYKGTDIAGLDPETNEFTRLFHPRSDSWTRHFEWDGPYLVGLTAVGQTTINVLRINHPDAINVRRFLMSEEMYL